MYKVNPVPFKKLEPLNVQAEARTLRKGETAPFRTLHNLFFVDSPEFSCYL